MKQQTIINIFSICLVLVLLTSCYEESDWLGDNVTSEGLNYPVIAGLSVVDSEDYYKEGSTIMVDLDYWSLDEIDKVILYESIGDGDPQEVNSFPFVSNFQEDSQTDELIMDYTIPNLPSDTIEITLDVEVVNVNGLTRNTKDGGTANVPSISIVGIK